MPKDRTNWEPEVKKGLEDVNRIKDLNQNVKDYGDERKIDGYNRPDRDIDSGKS